MVDVFCSNGHQMVSGQQACTTCGAPLAPLPPPRATGSGQTTAVWAIAGFVVVTIAAITVVFLATRDDPGGGSAAQQTTSSSTSVPGTSLTAADPSAGTSPGTPNSTTTSIPVDQSTTSSTTGPTTTLSATTTTSSTPTPTTTLPGPITAQNAGWTEVVETSRGGEEVRDLVATATGYLAIGSDGSTRIWTSADGVTWTRLPQQAAFDGAEMQHIEKAPDGTIVGVGRTTDTKVFTAWTSPDGAVWTRWPIAVAPAMAGVHQVHDLESHPDGFVAVGSVNAGDIDAAWWTSPDGITWTAATIAEPALQQMFGVAISDGFMVAAGEARPDTGIWRGRLDGPFRRVDDIALTTAVSDFDPTNTTARVFAWDIAATGPGFVAVGADQTTVGRSMAAAWTSTNGVRWSRFGNETEATPNMVAANFAGDGPWTVMDVVLDSDGTTFAIGRTGTTGDQDIVIWESVDGLTWVQGPIDRVVSQQQIKAAIAIDSKIVAVGADGALDGSGNAAFWLLEPSTGSGVAACAMDWSVQSGTATSTGPATATVAISRVDRSKSFLVFSTRHWSDRPTASVRGRIADNGRSVEFIRVTDETNQVDISWYVVTYPCGVRVQHGDFTGSPPTVDVRLDPLASTGQAFVLWSKTVDSFDGWWSDDDPTIAEITSPTNLQFRQSGIETGHAVSWQVVEFTDPATISVQRGTTSLVGNATTATITLPTAVDTARAFPLVSFRMNDGTLTDIGAHLIDARLDSPTTLIIERDHAGDNDIEEILWEVIELKDGSFVEHAARMIPGGSAAETWTVAPLTIDRAYAFATVQGSNGQSLGSTPWRDDEVQGAASFTFELAEPNQLTVSRSYEFDDATVGWVVVTR